MSALDTDRIKTIFSPMKDLQISKDIVPLGEFKAGAAQILKRLAGSRSPLVLTQNGRPAAVMLSPQEFDRLRERERFLESVAMGLADAEAGRVVDTDELRRRLAQHRTESTRR